MEKYRTFLAVPVKVDAAFLDARSRLMKALEGERISWVHPRNFHITIRFLGDTDPDKVEEISTAIGKQLVLPERKSLEFNGPGLFGPRKKPRVIWVGFQTADVFALLRQEVDRILISMGMPVPDADFRAHLTLGRIRAVRDLPVYRPLMDSMRPDFSGSVQAESLVFFRSEFREDGPVYSSLSEWMFR